jgi:hypothetical protein
MHCLIVEKRKKKKEKLHGDVVQWSPPAIDEIGAMGLEIESRQGIGW